MWRCLPQGRARLPRQVSPVEKRCAEPRLLQFGCAADWHADACLLLEDARWERGEKHSSVDGDHGRIETRSSLIQRDRSRVSLRSKFHLALGRRLPGRAALRQFEKAA